ncbi:hypothetical protein JCM11491_004134 [Sporobolomyces phaffii]
MTASNAHHHNTTTTASTPLTRSPCSPTLTGSTGAASKPPIRARVVDLAASVRVASSTTTTTLNHHVRVKAKPTTFTGGLVRSAPSTPTVNGAAFTTKSTTGTGVRAALSPPLVPRARSPDLVARTTTTATTRGTRGAASSDLRGQRDPFPSPSPSFNNVPITHLPASVSVRKLHSPSLRASASTHQHHRQQEKYFVSTSPTSPAASSSAASPRTSPNLHPSCSSSSSPYESASPHRLAQTGLGFYDPPVAEYYSASSSSIDRKPVRPAASVGRRRSGLSSLSSASSSSDAEHRPRTTTTTTTDGGGGGGLLPAFSHYSSPPPPPTTSTSTSFAHVGPYTTAAPRSPTLLPSSASTQTLRSVPIASTFPSSSLSSSTAAFDRPRSPPPPPLIPRTTTSRTLELSSSEEEEEEEDDSDFDAASSSFPFPRSDRRHLPPPWSEDGGDDDDGRAGDRTGAPQDRGGSNGVVDDADVTATTIAGSGSGATTHGMERLLRESIEKEIEAKVSRRIMDLEIRTSSLLSINAQLERHKLKQTAELRELRRKMRESLGGPIRQYAAAAAAIKSSSSSSGGGDFSDAEEEDDLSDDDDDDDEDEYEPSWDELVRADEAFGEVAALVEALIKRGELAVAFAVDPTREKTGRVLSTVEMEDRFQQQQGERDDDDEDEDEVEADEVGAADESLSSDGAASVE